MPVYKEDSRYHYYHAPVKSYRLYIRKPDERYPVALQVDFLLNDAPHRTDGPAVIAWDDKGTSKLYYLNGKLVDKDKYLQILQGPIDNLPLYINDPIYAPVAIDRLAGEKSSIEYLNPNPLEPEILKRMYPTSIKQVLIKNLTLTLRQAIIKYLMNIKPFKGDTYDTL
jgi:hypothetical protein